MASIHSVPNNAHPIDEGARQRECSLSGHDGCDVCRQTGCRHFDDLLRVAPPIALRHAVQLKGDVAHERGCTDLGSVLPLPIAVDVGAGVVGGVVHDDLLEDEGDGVAGEGGRIGGEHLASFPLAAAGASTLARTLAYRIVAADGRADVTEGDGCEGDSCFVVAHGPTP